MLVRLVGFRETIHGHLLVLLGAVGLVFGFPLTGWWEQAVNGSTVFDLFIYPFVLEFLFEGLINDFDQQVGWDHYDAVVITNDDVIWLHGGATAGDGAVHFPWHVAAPQDCGVVAVGIDRNIAVELGRKVTNTDVGEHWGCHEHLGGRGQHDSTRNGACFTASVHRDASICMHGIF